MLNHIQFIDEIFQKLSLVVEATGMNKAVLIVEIGNMLVTLQTGLKNDEKNHEEALRILQEQVDDLVKQLNGDEPIEKVTLNFEPTQTSEVDQNGA